MMSEDTKLGFQGAVLECDLSLMKCNAIMEAALRECDINKESAELKVLQESGTDSDLQYYYEAADEGLVQTIIKIIKQLKEAIIKFCSSIKDKVLSIIGKKENVEALDKIEKKVKFMPFLKKKKILVEDYNAQAKCADRAFDKLNRLKVKAKSGQKVSTAEVKEVKTSFIDEHKLIIGIGAAVTITVGVALGVLKSMGGKASSVTNDLQKRATTACDDCMKMAESIDNPEVAHALSEAIVAISKAQQEDYVRAYNGTLSQVKKAVKSVGKTKLDIEKAKRGLGMESTGGLNDDSVVDDSEVDDISSSATKDISEMGDDPEKDIPTDDDPEPDTDPWDDVMNTDVDLTQDEEDMLDYYGTTDSDPEVDEDEMDDDSMNESSLANMFDDIIAEACGRSTSQSSAYESLMSEIENLI